MAVIYWPSLTVLFSVFVDYILAQSNITLDFDCIENVSNSLPVTITDMDGVVLIPLYNMRTGIDLEKMCKKRVEESTKIKIMAHLVQFY